MDSKPRSAFDEVGGMLYFARMLDKIRLHAAGRLHPDFHANLGTAMDGRCTRYLHVEYAALVKRVLEGGTDEEIFAWCAANGRTLNAEELFVWNAFLRKRGLNDEVSHVLEAHKKASGLSHRDDLRTFPDYFEVDEGRRP
jgi:hypothetical protein